MSQSTTALHLRRPLYLAGLATALLVLFIIFYCDLALPRLVQSSDFLTCIYTGAKLFAQHRFAEIYAPYSAVQFAGTPCDIAAHQFLPAMPAFEVANFNYCPLIAWLFSPLTYLAPHLSLLVWQLLSLCALAAAVFLLGDNDEQRLTLASVCLLFLPTVFTLWIGQFGIVFGVLIVAVLYRLLLARRLLLAGIAMSLLILKPQFIILAGIPLVASLVRRQWKLVVGFLGGTVLLFLLNLLVGGPDLFAQWLWMLRLSEMVFNNPAVGVPKHLVISVPGYIFHTVPPNMVSLVKPFVYGTACGAGLLAAISCLRTFRDDYVLSVKMSLLSGLLLIPVLVAHFMYYDLTLLMLAWALSFDSELSRRLNLPLPALVLLLSAIVNAYAVVFLVNAKLAFAPILLVPFVVLLVLLLRAARRSQADTHHLSDTAVDS